MEITFKVTVPDSDVPTATENAPGLGGDLSEWLREFFEWNDKDYLRGLGLGEMTVQIVDVN